MMMRTNTDDEDMEVEFKSGIDKFHVSKKAIDRYGPAVGCPACVAIKKRGITTGRVGVNHNDICRRRVTTEMRKDPLYRQFMQKHDGSISTVEDQHNLDEQRGHNRKAIHALQQDVKKRISNITDQLDQAMMSRLVASMDVAEFYRRPLVAAAVLGPVCGSFHGTMGSCLPSNVAPSGAWPPRASNHVPTARQHITGRLGSNPGDD